MNLDDLELKPLGPGIPDHSESWSRDILCKGVVIGKLVKSRAVHFKAYATGDDPDIQDILNQYVELYTSRERQKSSPKAGDQVTAARRALGLD